MNSSFLATGVLLGCCSTLCGQGSVFLDNSALTNRVSIDAQANPYSGVFGMEAWQTSNTNSSLSALFDLTTMTNSLAAHDLLLANGFRLERTYVGQTAVQGVFDLGILYMPGVQTPAATVTL